MNPEKLKDEYQLVLADNDEYLALISKQREQLASVDIKIKEMQARVWAKKKAMGGRSHTQKRSLQQRKHVRIMEDRVNQATVRFDKLLSRNQAQRDDITHLRLERRTFAQMYERLERELLLQYNIMEDLVEKSVLAYDQRSEALARMLALRERSKKDASLCHTEMTELRRVIDHEIKLRSFMVKKSEETVPVGEEDEAKKRKTEQAQRERMGGESLGTYQAVYRLIVGVAGESDLRQIGRKFIENEEKSFAYFNYINELNNKSTMLNDRINKLRSEILHFELDNQQYDEQRQSQLKDLERELDQRRGLADGLQSQHTVVVQFLDQQKSAIAALFAKMKCNPWPIAGKLGCSAQVTDDNITQFIGILEDQMHGLLMGVAQSRFEEAEEMELPPQNPLLASCVLLPAMASSAIETPSSCAADDPATDALLGPGVDVPLDFQSLCARVLPRVLQTEQGKTEQGKAARRPSAAQRSRKKVGFGPKSA